MYNAAIIAWARSVAPGNRQFNEALHAAFDVLLVPQGQLNERVLAYTATNSVTAGMAALEALGAPLL